MNISYFKQIIYWGQKVKTDFFGVHIEEHFFTYSCLEIDISGDSWGWFSRFGLQIYIRVLCDPLLPQYLSPVYLCGPVYYLG